MLKRSPTNRFLDKLHRGAVWVCMGVTIYATSYLVYRGYAYYANVRPQKKIEELNFIQEGAHDKDSALQIST